MATPLIAQLADAMLVYFKQAGITDAERRWAPYADAESLNTRRVVVLCRNRQKERGSRTGDTKTFWLEIHVQQQVSPSDNTTIDNLVSTIEVIWGLWESGGSLRDVKLAGCKWLGTDNGIEFERDDLYDVESLRDDGIFSSVTLVRYRLDN